MSPSEAAAAEPVGASTFLRQAAAAEAKGQVTAAFNLYRAAMAVAAHRGEVAPALAGFARRVEYLPLAEQTLGEYAGTDAPVGLLIELAAVQGDQGAFDRAQATLGAALEARPEEARLWSALGWLLCRQGRHAEAVVFLEEALRLDPELVQANDILADVIALTGGDLARALSLGEAARAAASKAELPEITAAHARRLLAAGHLPEGLAAFAAGAAGDTALVTHRLAAPRWRIGSPAPGQVVVFGEEALADEILLASLVPTLPRAAAPYILAVGGCWRSLAERSFPQTHVVLRLSRAGNTRPLRAAALDSVQIHAGKLVSAFTTLRELLPVQRLSGAGFAPAPYLIPHPGQVTYWRAWLDTLGPGLKVGVQRHLDPHRPEWEAPPAALLHPALLRDGVRLVDLPAAGAVQTDAPTAFALPPGLEADDLDGLAALTAALDVVVGPAGLTTYVAGGVGARTFILAPPRHWAMLGTDGYPWFSRARAFTADAIHEWDRAVADLSDALSHLVGGAGNA